MHSPTDQPAALTSSTGPQLFLRSALAVLLLCLPVACAGDGLWSQGTGTDNPLGPTPTDDDDDEVDVLVEI